MVTFNDLGDIVEIIELGDRRSGRNFYYRLPEGAFHTLLVRIEFIVLHEVTTGPFLRELEALRPPKGAGQNECMHSVVIESAHEYKNRTLFARKLTIPEACSLQARLPPHCMPTSPVVVLGW